MGRKRVFTTVGVSQHGDAGQLLVSPLRSQQAPLPAQRLQRRADLQLALPQQPLLHLRQRLP